MQHGVIQRRRFTLLGSAAVATLLASVPAIASAQALNFGTPGGFGNLSCLDGTTAINLASYSGFSFGGLRISQPSQFTGKCAASNSGLTTNASITALGGGSFTFESARFADAFPSGSTAIMLRGFLGATQVFSNTLSLGSSVGAGTLFTNTTVGAITRLDIVQTGTDPFLLDDFATSSAVVVTATPEPGTWALFAAGLALMIPLARCKRRV